MSQQAVHDRSRKSLHRLAREHTEKMQAGVRVERRKIVVRGVEYEVDVTICPTSEAIGDAHMTRHFGRHESVKRGAARSRGRLGTGKGAKRGKR